MIRKTLAQDHQVISLLRAETRMRLLENPSYLFNMIDPAKKGIVIDEIQKIPDLLDEIYDLIEEKKIKFLMTGSSARKLKRQHANLLGGRAKVLEMFGVTHLETPEIPLLKKIEFGSLPAILQSEDPWDDLKSYADTYLKEEIEEEAATRNISQFLRFLKIAALQSVQLLNYAGIANDVGLSESTVRSYFQILKDTLIGYPLEPCAESKKRKAIQTVKFYLFDGGVQAALVDRKHLNRNSPDFGVALEHWILHELRAWKSYKRNHLPIHFWCSTAKHEVDFCIGVDLAIEVKTTTRLSKVHFLKFMRTMESVGWVASNFQTKFEETHSAA